jgi:glycosyltransferase involved in cell wall biosynthesis
VVGFRWGDGGGSAARMKPGLGDGRAIRTGIPTCVLKNGALDTVWFVPPSSRPVRRRTIMTVPVAIDLTRLFVGPLSVTPRGIDRVDLGYARHFLENWRGGCIATLATPLGVRGFERHHALRLVTFVEHLWRETVDPEEDAAYQRARAWLRGEASVEPRPARHSACGVRSVLDGFLRLILEVGVSLGRSAVRSVPLKAIYLNTGHITLAGSHALGWLGQRPDVRPVFMLHDTIPIDHAEYTAPKSRLRHQRIVANAARYAAGIIVTTEAAGESVRREVHRCGRSDVAITAVPLPVPPAFLGSADECPDLSGAQYFVVCGALDPRKNHLLLLTVWRELVRRDGDAAPKLVLVGSRHRTSDAVIDLLERCASIRDHVLEVSGLSSPGLRRLLMGASGLLMPSFAEGFGIPIIEALAVGTPVIASDLKVHREVGGNHATYLSPIDGLGWLSAIQTHAANQSIASDRRTRLESYRPFTWADYFQRLEPFIQSIPSSPLVRGNIKSDGAGGPPLQAFANPAPY